MRKVFLLLVTFVILVLTAGCDKSNNDIEGKYVMYPDRNPHAIYFIEIIDKKAMINGHDAYELKMVTVRLNDDLNTDYYSTNSPDRLYLDDKTKEIIEVRGGDSIFAGKSEAIGSYNTKKGELILEGVTMQYLGNEKPPKELTPTFGDVVNKLHEMRLPKYTKGEKHLDFIEKDNIAIQLMYK